MKQLKKFLPMVFLAGLPLIGLSNAQASSEFSSSATIGFSIEGITNNTTGITSQDLAIFASFEQDSSSYANITGNALINDINPDDFGDVLSLPTTSYSHTFSISGNANNGSIDSYYLGLYGLGLFNTSLTDTYTVDLSFSYLLSSSASGEKSDTDVKIDYFSDEDFSFGGEDYVDHSYVFGFPVSNASGAGAFSITLTPQSAASYLADVVITGNLEASPVPLPATVWMFLSGLIAVVGLKKRRIFVV